MLKPETTQEQREEYERIAHSNARMVVESDNGRLGPEITVRCILSVASDHLITVSWLHGVVTDS